MLLPIASSYLLTEAADQVGEGNYSRIEVKSADEIGHLAKVFNKMVRGLDLGYAVISNDRINRVFPVKVHPRITIHGGLKY